MKLILSPFGGHWNLLNFFLDSLVFGMSPLGSFEEIAEPILDFLNKTPPQKDEHHELCEKYFSNQVEVDFSSQRVWEKVTRKKIEEIYGTKP